METAETTHQRKNTEHPNDTHPSVDAVEKNTARMANAAEALVARFERQNSFKAEALRIGATAVATGLVTGLVFISVQALLSPATPELAPLPGSPKK